MRLVDAHVLENNLRFSSAMRSDEGLVYVPYIDVKKNIDNVPTIPAIPVEWLNERHSKACGEGDTDMMDAITVLCNEYHVWQKEQEAR